MWYLFNKENKCFGTSDNEVNAEDLKLRNEYAVESDEIYEDFTKLKYLNYEIICE